MVQSSQMKNVIGFVLNFRDDQGIYISFRRNLEMLNKTRYLSVQEQLS
jgi:hypothetical protein